MEFAPLHKIPEFQSECAEVLNEEWKRSLNARLHSLEKSRDSFPICLVLLERSDGKQHVRAHSMLSVVRGQSEPSCLVESVVVCKSHRGKGYGRIVMQKTEEFAASKGYEVMYLTTHDKQKFYEHLGYEYCSPVVTISSDVLPENLANKLMESLAIITPKGDSERCNDQSTNKTQNYGKDSKTQCDREASENIQDENTPSSPKEAPPTVPIAQPPPFVAPPPPPVAPPPPPPTNCKSLPDKSGDKQATRWDPNCVSWMKKRIT